MIQPKTNNSNPDIAIPLKHDSNQNFDNAPLKQIKKLAL